MAPDGLSHKFGITQGEHPCRDCLDAANIMLAVSAWDLPAGSYLTGAQAGAAYEVSMHLVPVLAVLPGRRSAGAVLLPGWST